LLEKREDHITPSDPWRWCYLITTRPW